MKALSSVLGAYMLLITITFVLFEFVLIANDLASKFREDISSEASRLSMLINNPVMSLKYSGDTIYLCINPIEPLRLKYLIIQYVNGTIVFREIDSVIENYTEIPVLENYDGTPVRIGFVTDNGVVSYYTPSRDPGLLSVTNYSVLNKTYIDNELVSILESNDGSLGNYNGLANPETLNETRVVVNNGTIWLSDNVLSSPLRIRLSIQGLNPRESTVSVYEPIRIDVSVKKSGSAKVKLFDLEISGYKFTVYAVYFCVPRYIYGADGYPYDAIYPGVVGIEVESDHGIIFKGHATVTLSPIYPGAVGSIVNVEKTTVPVVYAPVSEFYGESYARYFSGYLSYNGTAKGDFISSNALVLAIGHYHDVVVNADINITELRIVKPNMSPRKVYVSKSIYYSTRQYIVSSTSDYWTMNIRGFFNLVYNGTKVELMIPVDESTILTRIVPEDKWNYMFLPQGYCYMLAWSFEMPLVTKLRISVQKVSSNVYKTVVTSEYSATPIGLLAPGLMLVNDVLVDKTIEYYIGLKPYSKLVEIKQGNPQYVNTIIYSGLSFNISNPLDKNIVLYIIRLEPGSDNNYVFYFDLTNSDYVLAKHTIASGEEAMKLDLEPGTYLFITRPYNPIEAASLEYYEVLIVRII